MDLKNSQRNYGEEVMSETTQDQIDRKYIYLLDKNINLISAMRNDIQSSLVDFIANNYMSLRKRAFLKSPIASSRQN